MNDAVLDSQHLMTAGEIVWGAVLIAITLAIHAFGMLTTLSAAERLWRDRPVSRFANGVLVLILASWIIVLVHLAEVAVWAGFLVWRDAFASTADAFYYTLLQYTTVGSGLSLPDRSRLLGGMIAMAGLLTFAWSTTVLLTLAQRFENAELATHRRAERASTGSE